MTVDTKSQWYPYKRVQDAYFDLSTSVNLPRKICDYLIDAPKGEYTPADDNAHSRVRLWKYLFYDGAKPLNEPLPTIEEKMSVVFDPEHPTDPPTERGYRLVPQVFVRQAQTVAQTRIMCYMGRTVPSNDELKISLSVVFYIWTHYQQELNTQSDAYSRCFAIEQALIESLHGVNMDGVGIFFFAKSKHPDCGSRTIFDGESNVGRELTIALEIATAATGGSTEWSNMPFFTPDGGIRIP